MAHAKNLDIERLRAVAIVSVFLVHVPGAFPPPPWLGEILDWTNLRIGVDLFFVISGFLIGRSLLQSLPHGIAQDQVAPALRAFWIRRAFRLWPAAWLWAVISIPIFLKADHHLPQLVQAAAAAIFQISNFQRVSCLALEKPWTVCTTAGHSQYWSLSLEEQFYIALPLAMLLLGRRFALVAGLAAAVQFFASRADWPLAWAFRTDALLIGVLLAHWSRKQNFSVVEPVGLKGASAVLLTVMAVAGWVLAIASLSITGSPFTYGVAAVFSGGLVYIAAFGKGYISFGPLNKCAEWIGSRSYSIYLSHLTALALGRIWMAKTGYLYAPGETPGIVLWGVLGGTIILTLAFSELTFRLVEQPMRDHGRRLTDQGRTIEAAIEPKAAA